MKGNASAPKRGMMRIERFLLPGLAQVFYLIASGNEAVVLYPAGYQP
jgi:hypothetical protein